MTNSGRPMKATSYNRTEPSDIRLVVEVNMAPYMYKEELTALKVALDGPLARFHPFMGVSKAGRLALGLTVFTVSLEDAVRIATDSIRASLKWAIVSVQLIKPDGRSNNWLKQSSMVRTIGVAEDGSEDSEDEELSHVEEASELRGADVLGTAPSVPSAPSTSKEKP